MEVETVILLYGANQFTTKFPGVFILRHVRELGIVCLVKSELLNAAIFQISTAFGFIQKITGRLLDALNAISHFLLKDFKLKIL